MSTELEQLIIYELVKKRRELAVLEKERDELLRALDDVRNGRRLNSKKYQSIIRNARIKRQSKRG